MAKNETKIINIEKIVKNIKSDKKLNQSVDNNKKI